MNRCVMCGAVIPEGRQVCWICEKKNSKKVKKIIYKKETK